jgi:hypothetical protein
MTGDVAVAVESIVERKVSIAVKGRPKYSTFLVADHCVFDSSHKATFAGARPFEAVDHSPNVVEVTDVLLECHGSPRCKAVG